MKPGKLSKGHALASCGTILSCSISEFDKTAIPGPTDAQAGSSIRGGVRSRAVVPGDPFDELAEDGLRVCLVSSSGGHLAQLLALRPLWERLDRCWVTFDKADAVSQLGGERLYAAAYPTNRDVPNLVRNTWLALRVLRRERPDVIISTGAGVAIPFFMFGRLFGATLVYLEVFDRIESATITGRFCSRLAHVFALQWEEQRRIYGRGVVVGPIL